VLPEFKDRDLASASRQTERRARINEKAWSANPGWKHREIIIPAAGHH
jgi:hypothetical protein